MLRFIGAGHRYRKQDRGSIMTLFAISFGTIILIVCLGLEVYLIVLGRQQSNTYAELLSEAVLRRFSLLRNDPDFLAVGDRQQEAITEGTQDANSSLNKVIVGAIPTIDSIQFGRWNSTRNSFLEAAMDQDANAVRVSVTGKSASLVLDRILGSSSLGIMYKATATAAVDESLMEREIYPHVNVFE